MEKKQSSIEWLIEELNHNIEFIPLAHWDKIRDIVQQAKAMHKEESIEFVKTCREAMATDDYSINHWYNKTFGGNNE